MRQLRLSFLFHYRNGEILQCINQHRMFDHEVNGRGFDLGNNHVSILQNLNLNVSEGGYFVQLEMIISVSFRIALCFFQVRCHVLVGIQNRRFKEAAGYGKIHRMVLIAFSVWQGDFVRYDAGCKLLLHTPDFGITITADIFRIGRADVVGR